MTYRDRPCGPSGRREVAGDAAHRQGFPTPSDGPHGRSERRLVKAFGQRRARLAMPRIATPLAPWYNIPRSRLGAIFGAGEDWPSQKDRRCQAALARSTSSQNSLVVLTRGNGSSGAGQPRYWHSGAQPSATSITSRRSAATASITAASRPRRAYFVCPRDPSPVTPDGAQRRAGVHLSGGDMDPGYALLDVPG